MKHPFFKTKLVAIALCAAALINPAYSAGKVYRLKLAETWPTNFPIFGDATKNMADMAQKMSNGRLKISIDSKNKHKSKQLCLDTSENTRKLQGNYLLKSLETNACMY